MAIKVMIKNVYGNSLIYPACDVSREFCKLNGSKTITQSMLNTLKLFSVSIERVHEEVEL